MAINFCSFVPADKRDASILHPDFSTLKYSSIFHLSLYQFIRSIASSKLPTGMLVSIVQSIGSTPTGALISLALTT